MSATTRVYSNTALYMSFTFFVEHTRSKYRWIPLKLALCNQLS